MSANTGIQDLDGTAVEYTLDGARDLLTKALEVIDALGVSPDVGARLQEVIDSLEQNPEEGKRGTY